MTQYASGFAVVVADPITADIDDIVFNITDNTWKRYNGTTWIATSSTASTVGKGARFYRNASLNVSASTVTAIQLTSTQFNDDVSYFSLNTGTGLITISKAGLYLIDFYGSCTLSANNSFSLFIRQSGTTKQEAGGYVAANIGARIAGSTILRIGSNETIGLYCYYGSSGTSDATTDPKDVGIVLAYLGS